MGEVGVGLTRVQEGDGNWSLPEAAEEELAIGHDLYERGCAEEAEARAAVAEAEAQRCRRAALEARWEAGTYRGLFKAARAKLAKAREEVKAVRRTACEALSLKAEVERLHKLLEAKGWPPNPGAIVVSLRRSNAALSRKNASLRGTRENTGLRRQARAEAEERAGMAARTEALEAEVADLRSSRAVLSKSLYGKKSERQQPPRSKRRRGQQPGAPGHGRTPRPELEEHTEVLRPPEAARMCGGCGAPYAVNGEQTTTLVEIEVKAHKRRIVRPRWRRRCDCGDAPREVTAPPPDRLFARTPYGVTVWACVLFERFVCHRPLNGVAAWLTGRGLAISAGTLVGGLTRLAPLFEPLARAILDRQDRAPVRHADETGWRIQSLKQAGRSSRARLWVSVTPDAVYFHIDPSRSAEAALKVFGGVVGEQVLVVDRLSTYKKLARILDARVILSWCWAYVADRIMLRRVWNTLPHMRTLRISAT